ncbi:uncharacterized protein I206_101193 [Kwoniella pini CBS 10737]|uniref:Uncharacterized protein n=1 Tax=Kwoniella pini CBS 10737 TaxID=1296096 RepID=A0A1B9IBK1_9TREE|nr:uncharacterized protein I206_00130 [Kwoniella pini CBS 10737]OCF52834.1 hypothetical protein I206_00130 [Kwoniella pini CBS 10737]
MTTAIYPPRARRTVDNILVLTPRYYPDPGPDGFYPELQRPVQTRLGVRFNDRLNKDVYFQLNAVFMTGLRLDFTQQDLKNLFKHITSEVCVLLIPFLPWNKGRADQRKQIRFTALHPHGNKNVSLACMEFSSAAEADEVIIFVTTHRHLFGDNNIHVRHSDINASGYTAGSTMDILLVSEVLALSPPYTPRSGSSNTSSGQLPDGWHAAGFSRDFFKLKRSSSPTLICPNSSKKYHQTTPMPTDRIKSSSLTGRSRSRNTDQHVERPSVESESTWAAAEGYRLGNQDRLCDHNRKFTEGNCLKIPSGPKSLLQRIDMSTLAYHPSASRTCAYQMNSAESTLPSEKLEELSAKLDFNIDYSPTVVGNDRRTLEDGIEHAYSPKEERTSSLTSGLKHDPEHPVSDHTTAQKRIARSLQRRRSFNRTDGTSRKRRSSSQRHGHFTDRRERRHSHHPQGRKQEVLKKSITLKDLKAFHHYFVSRDRHTNAKPEPKYVGISEDGEQLIFGKKRRIVEKAFLCGFSEEKGEEYNLTSDDTNGVATFGGDDDEGTPLKNSLEVNLSETEEEIEEIEDERFRRKKVSLIDIHDEKEKKEVAAQRIGEIVEGEISESGLENGLHQHSSLDEIYNQPTQDLFFEKSVTNRGEGQTKNLAKSPVLTIPPSIDKAERDTNKDNHSTFTVYRVDELSEEVLEMMGIELRYTFNNDSLNSAKAWKQVNETPKEANDDKDVIKVLQLVRTGSEDQIDSILSDVSSGREMREVRRSKIERGKPDRTII